MDMVGRTKKIDTSQTRKFNDFEQDPMPVYGTNLDHQRFTLNIEGYEGPIDVLLDMAKSQKVDLLQISVLALTTQYLNFIEQAREIKLDLAGEYLVMAAWLTYLKSKLLLPEDPKDQDEDIPSGEELAEKLKLQLQHLEKIRNIAQQLLLQPRFETDYFAKGLVQKSEIAKAPQSYIPSLYNLIEAYAGIRAKSNAQSNYRMKPFKLMSADKASEVLKTLFLRFRDDQNKETDWISLDQNIPDSSDSLHHRSSHAAMLLSGLEMAKGGAVNVKQKECFKDVFMKAYLDKINNNRGAA